MHYSGNDSGLSSKALGFTRAEPSSNTKRDRTQYSRASLPQLPLIVEGSGRERDSQIAHGQTNTSRDTVEIIASLQGRLADANERLTRAARHLEEQKTIAEKALSAITDLIARSQEVAAVGLRLKDELGRFNAKAPEGDAIRRMARLTPRQRAVMELILAGHPNKIIAAELGISIRTVENHRAVVKKRTGCASLPALVRLSIAAFDQAHERSDASRED